MYLKQLHLPATQPAHKFIKQRKVFGTKTLKYNKNMNY